MMKMKYVFKATLDPGISFETDYEQSLFRLIGLHVVQENKLRAKNDGCAKSCRREGRLSWVSYFSFLGLVLF